eukprot:s670_g6.t2
MLDMAISVRANFFLGYGGGWAGDHANAGSLVVQQLRLGAGRSYWCAAWMHDAACSYAGARMISEDSPSYYWAFLSEATCTSGERLQSVVRAERQNRRWELTLSDSTVLHADHVVNATGLGASTTEALVPGPTLHFQPRRGDYLLFRRPAPSSKPPLSTPIGSVPTPAARGVYVWPTVHGDVVVGPTNVKQDHSSIDAPSKEVVAGLREKALQVCPALSDWSMAGSYAGLRPALEPQQYGSDFLVRTDVDLAWTTVAGVRSTGLTASLGLAERVLARLRPSQPLLPTSSPTLPSLAALAEDFAARCDGRVEVAGRSWYVLHPQTRLGLAVSDVLATLRTMSESSLPCESIDTPEAKCHVFSAAMGTGASVEQRFRKPNARRVNLFNILTEIMKETKREEEIPEDHWELLMKALETDEQEEVKQLKEDIEKERASRVAQEKLVEKLKEELKQKEDQQEETEKELKKLKAELKQKDEASNEQQESEPKPEDQVIEDQKQAADCETIHDAAGKSVAAVRHFLRDAPTAVNKKDENDSRPLHIAARRGCTDVEQQADVNARNNFNGTPLDWAASKNRAEEIKILLAAKANIMVVDNHGRTPLHGAAISGCSEAVRILVEAEQKASFLEAKDKSGQTRGQLWAGPKLRAMRRCRSRISRARLLLLALGLFARAMPRRRPSLLERALEEKSRLKKQKTKLLMHQVIEKQKLERVLKDIMQLEAEKNQEGDVDPEAVKAKAQDALKAADLTMQRNMTTAVAYMMPMVVQPCPWRDLVPLFRGKGLAASVTSVSAILLLAVVVVTRQVGSRHFLGLVSSESVSMWEFEGVELKSGDKVLDIVCPSRRFCRGGSLDQMALKVDCHNALKQANEWGAKCHEKGYKQKEFEFLEKVNDMSHEQSKTVENTHIFRQTWKKVLDKLTWEQYEWTVKVDLDAVFFPDRLGALLKDAWIRSHAQIGNGVWLNNCSWSQRIYDTIDKRTKKAQEMIARAAVEEVKNLTKDMQDVFEVQDIKAQIFKSIGEIDTPSLATVVASAFAPAQLRALHLSNLISTAVVFLAVLVDAFVLFGDRGSKCNSYVGTGDKIGMVDFWYQVDLGISSFCFLVRYWTYLTLKPIVEDLNSPPVIELQDDPVKVLRSLLAYYLNTGSQAILKVDSVSGSYLYALSNWSVVFNLLWIGFAGDVVLNTPWKVCANVGMVVLRIRFILFLILIVPVLLNVVLFFAGRFLSGQGLQITLLNTANAADEGLGLGVPVCSVLVQAFFIRNKRDMINIQLKLLQMKKDEAEKRRLEAEAELKSLQGNEESSTAEVQKLQESLQQEAGKTPDDSHKEQEEHREKVLGEAEQVFGLLNERAKKASAEAEAQVKKWEDGDGGELLQAMSKGEGAAKLQQMLGQVDYRGMASDYAAQAQKMAGDLQEQDWVKDAAKRAADAAQAAQQSSQELYNSEQMQQMLSSEQMQSALATGQASVV